jgi:hypothetical protein
MAEIGLGEQLVLLGGIAEAPAEIALSFLQTTFAIAGLPLRKPASDTATWSRSDTTFAYTVSPHSQELPGGATMRVGVPYGAKARLLACWLATEVQNPARGPDDLWIEIGNPTSWLRSIGIPPYGSSDNKVGSIEQTKDQLMRLAFARFSMVLKGADNRSLFASQSLIDGAVFPADALEAYARDEVRSLKWPEAVRMTQDTFDRFRKSSVAVPTEYLSQVAHSAMEIDMLVFFAYSLPRIPAGESVLVTWEQVIRQFGKPKRSGDWKQYKSKFRQDFQGGIEHVLAIYKDADVTITDEGLLMRRSDPARVKLSHIPALPKGRRRAIPATLIRSEPEDASADWRLV